MAQTAREASLARRKALSTSGKAAISGNAERTRSAPAKAVTTEPVATAAPAASASVAPVASYTPAPKVANLANSARKASLERRMAMSKGGKRAVAGGDRTRTAPAKAAEQVANTERKEGCGCGCGGKNAEATTTAAPSMSLTDTVTAQVQQKLVKKAAMSSARAASLSRRKAMSAKGKSALKGGTVSEASAARAANPELSSRELAQVLRTQRSQKGKTNSKKSTTTATGPGRHRKAQAPAEDQPWKVGVTETASGQSVTGTMVDRVPEVTGNEASTCRDVTGTEYMGADVFKDFCQTDAKAGFNRVSVTTTGTGNSVSGSAVGRSGKVTGDEPGTCKNVTGTEYVSAEQAQAYCGTRAPSTPAKFSMAQTMKGKTVSGSNVGRSEKVTGDEPGSGRQLTGSQYMQSGEGNAPAKVGRDNTLRGGSVSGTMVGRSEKVTGDEPGSCRNVTGDDYVGQGQYEGFCKSSPAPADNKVGVSQTMAGKVVTGTMTGRSGTVTGDEPGTCKTVTGTPYAGAAEMANFCKSDDMKAAHARTAPVGGAPMGKPLTGLQPSVGGVMTGDDRGACEPVSGTPYVGADQMAQACPAVAAAPNSPDFPQSLSGDAPWTDFSVSSPAIQAQAAVSAGNVTGGNSYEKSGQITGPFGMADGKVTGTEEARFGNKVTPAPLVPVVETATEIEGRVKSRVTGEGQNAGKKITGDDWDRGDRVTGTEGTSATRRNPTRRGPVSAMTVEPKRNEEVALPVSKVTGGSGGSSDNGSLITYSGGARG